MHRFNGHHSSGVASDTPVDRPKRRSLVRQTRIDVDDCEMGEIKSLGNSASPFDGVDIGMTRAPHVNLEADDGDGENDGRSWNSDGKIFTIDVEQTEVEDRRHLRGKN